MRTWSTPAFVGNDFGTASSPLAAGYTAVDATIYSAALGYGWLSETVTTHDRATGTALTQDGNATAYALRTAH